MSTSIVEGYSKFYQGQHNKVLPQETVDKIMLLYHNRIKRHCREVGLIVEEEEQRGAEDASIDYHYYTHNNITFIPESPSPSHSNDPSIVCIKYFYHLDHYTHNIAFIPESLSLSYFRWRGGLIFTVDFSMMREVWGEWQ
jgi:hypothetical protein